MIAMTKELHSLNKNKTWELIPKPRSAKIVGSKWIFKNKDGISGVEPPRYKARLVVEGLLRRKGYIIQKYSLTWSKIH